MLHVLLPCLLPLAGIDFGCILWCGGLHGSCAGAAWISDRQCRYPTSTCGKQLSLGSLYRSWAVSARYVPRQQQVMQLDRGVAYTGLS